MSLSDWISSNSLPCHRQRKKSHSEHIILFGTAAREHEQSLALQHEERRRDANNEKKDDDDSGCHGTGEEKSARQLVSQRGKHK